MPAATWFYADIEKDTEGWWVVTLGTHQDGTQAKEQRKLFPHSKIDRGAARWAAHLHAWDIAEKEGLRYLT